MRNRAVHEERPLELVLGHATAEAHRMLAAGAATRGGTEVHARNVIDIIIRHTFPVLQVPFLVAVRHGLVVVVVVLGVAEVLLAVVLGAPFALRLGELVLK